jgi:DNA polymerase III epsilon subunit-like protein
MVGARGTKMKKYISIDTETGGIGIDKSLLTIGLACYDENLNEVAYSHLKIRPDNGIYQITAKALEINKIDLIAHQKEALTEKEGRTALYTILSDWSQNGLIKLIPIGKQIDGDLAQIWDKLISRNSWETFVSYRKIEVSSVMIALQDAGLLPTFKGSLTDCITYYGIKDSGLHDALEDARMTAQVYKCMVEDLKNVVSQAESPT